MHEAGAEIPWDPGLVALFGDGYLNAIEHGRRHPQVRSLEKLASALDAEAKVIFVLARPPQLFFDLLPNLGRKRTVFEDDGGHRRAQGAYVPGRILPVDLELPAEPVRRVGEEAGYGACVGGGLSGLLLYRASPRVR